MKKIMAMLAILVLMLCLVGGCSNKEGQDTQSKNAEEANTELTDKGSASASEEKKEVYILLKNRGDLSYWDSMASGGDRAKIELADKANVYVIETTDDMNANLDAMYEAVDKGADLIVTAGDFKDNVLTVSTEYPNIGYVVIGEDLTDESELVYCVDFRTSEAAFLAGIVAADVASEGAGKDHEKTIGFIGGMDETLVIQEFLMGYIQGAKYYDADTRVVMNYVGNWGDPDTAKTQALTQYNDAKADIIFACAGGSGNGVHTAAAEVGKFVIGVDSDQAQMYDNAPDIQKSFATSVLKEIGNAVFASIEKFLEENGKLPYGEHAILGLSVDAVSIIENDALQAVLSEHGKEVLAEAKEKIAKGEIEIESAIDKDQTEIKAFIEAHTK